MSVSVRKLRLVNPRRRKKSGSRRNHRRKRNTGGGELFIMTNPKRKRRNSRRRNRSRARNRRNPFMRARKAHRGFRRRNRRNPSIAGFQADQLLKLGAGAAGGAIGTRYLTQMFLQDKNTGVTGYGVSALMAVALGYITGKYVDREVANGVVAGGLAAVLLRLWSEQVSGTSAAALSGYLGDLDFSSNALGAYSAGSYPVPFYNYPAPALAAAAPVAVPAARGSVRGR